ncbi:hypothetical protein FXO38_26412 [Capsicum annuum]|nr:hypothetical protein FXO37_28632 [Capsicum annuum]KAF3631909.1 hypothetical protein FXO38_26412 [Capsicum annuum]
MSTPNTPPISTVIPPKPPDPTEKMDIESTKYTSFKNVLLNKEKEINRSYSIYDGHPIEPSEDGDDAIELTEAEKQRFYQP